MISATHRCCSGITTGHMCARSWMYTISRTIATTNGDHRTTAAPISMRLQPAPLNHSIPRYQTRSRESPLWLRTPPTHHQSRHIFVHQRHHHLHTHSYHQQTTNHPLELNTPEQSNTTVILIGWLGCTEKNLKKYGELHQKLGYHCIEYRPSPLTPFLPTITHDPSLKLLLKLLTIVKQHPSTHQLIFHLMSNNGAYHFAYLMHILHHDPAFTHHDPAFTLADRELLLLHIRGLIFDSAPSELNPDIFAKGYLGFLSGRMWHQSIYEHPILTPVMRAAFTALLSIPFFKRKQELLYHSIHHLLPPTAHLLYVHSHEDALIPHEHIERHAREQARMTSKLNVILRPPTTEEEEVKSSTASPFAILPVSSLMVHLAQNRFQPLDTAFDDLLELYSEEAELRFTPPILPTTCTPLLTWTVNGIPTILRLVTTFRFKDSGHVAHYRSYPRDYQQLVQSFIESLGVSGGAKKVVKENTVRKSHQ